MEGKVLRSLTTQDDTMICFVHTVSWAGGHIATCAQ